MGVRITRLMFTVALAVGAGYYIKPGCENQRPMASAVHPVPGSKPKLGAFANDASDGRHLACLEGHIGKGFDLSVRYLRIDRELFPSAEARFMGDGSSALFLKIKITPSLLPKLGSGKYDARLAALNAGLREYGGRIFVGFDLSEVLGSGDLPSIFDRFSKKLTSGNVTWVWDPAFGEIPTGKKIEWTSIEIFQRQVNGRWPTLEEMLLPKLEEAKKKNLAVLLTVGSSGPEDIQAKFVEDAVRIATENDSIDYLIFHNVPTTRKGKFENWQLTPKALTALKTSLESRQSALDAGAPSAPPSGETLESYFVAKNLDQKGAEYLRGRLGLDDPLDPLLNVTQKCEEIEKEFYKVDDIQKLAMHRTEIREINTLLKRSLGSSQEAPLRQALASHYADMSYLFKNDENKKLALLTKAVAILREPFKQAQEQIKEGKRPDRFPIVKGYFDMIIQIASDIDRTGDSQKAEKIYLETLENLDDKKIQVEQQVSSYSRAGYRSRIHVQLGLIHERRGEFTAAENLYEIADGWATAEQSRNWLSLFWRGEDRTKLRHTAALAKLGQARIALAGSKPDAALKVIGPLFRWPEIGSEKGFMDLGLQGLILTAKAILEDSPNLASAEARFRQALPWSQINQLKDLKRALDCEDADFSSYQTELLGTVLQGLANVNLDFESTMLLKELQIKYEILRKN